MGGIPIKMCVFPKNRDMAVASSDYAVFQDRILPTSNIPTGTHWYEILYKQVLKIE